MTRTDLAPSPLARQAFVGVLSRVEMEHIGLVGAYDVTRKPEYEQQDDASDVKRPIQQS